MKCKRSSAVHSVQKLIHTLCSVLQNVHFVALFVPIFPKCWENGMRACCVLDECLMCAWCLHDACLLLVTSLVCTFLCFMFTSCVLNALFEFPSKTRHYQRVTFICLWVISQYLLTPKYGRAELLPSQRLVQSECTSCLTGPISWISVRWLKWWRRIAICWPRPS